MAKRVPILAFVFQSLAVSPALADDGAKFLGDPGKRVPGWSTLLNVGASLNFSSNHQVVGKMDGSNYTLGFNVEKNLELNRDAHEWRNHATFDEAFTKSPLVRKPVKSNDVVGVESIYLHHLGASQRLGPFARATVDTALFQGFDLRPAPRTYRIARSDGSVETLSSDHLKLTDALSPTRMKQSLGAFGSVLEDERARLELRLGAGFREVFSKGELAVIDDPNTAEIEVTELSSYWQVGPELGASQRGKFSERHVSYRLSGEFLLPLVSDGPLSKGKSAFALAYVELAARLSFKLFEWASLDYQFKAAREPLLVNVVQVQNSFLLTFNYQLL